LELLTGEILHIVRIVPPDESLTDVPGSVVVELFQSPARLGLLPFLISISQAIPHEVSQEHG
jgi:hypothetical protein